MFIDVLWTREELVKYDLNDAVVVVADVLRATTVMVTALTNGAREILPQPTEQAAREVYENLAQENAPALLCGEREGVKIAGFDLGNAPREFTPDVVLGKSVVHLTTNGTRALSAAADATRIYAACFQNRSATAHLLLSQHAGDRVLLTASGKESFFCLEDVVCLGGVIDAVLSSHPDAAQLTDAATAACVLFKYYKDDLNAMIHHCSHGKYLALIGLGEDLPVCAQLDTSQQVPVMSGGKIILG